MNFPDSSFVGITVGITPYAVMRLGFFVGIDVGIVLRRSHAKTIHPVIPTMEEFNACAYRTFFCTIYTTTTTLLIPFFFFYFFYFVDYIPSEDDRLRKS